MKPTVKTVIAGKEGVYSSFPTFACHENRMYIYYRQGVNHSKTPHGNDGAVKRLMLEKEAFQEWFTGGSNKALESIGNTQSVFQGANEMDAILSPLDSDLFALSTRNFDMVNKMRTFISFSSTPHFKDRCEVSVRGVRWLAFYGKAFRWEEGLVFPAYGEVSGDPGSRPLLLITDDCEKWHLLSYLPSNFEGVILNESSVAKAKGLFTIFMRQDSQEFGIWYAQSKDLQNWSHPQKLFPRAHAPMALHSNGITYLCFRDILGAETASLSVATPFDPFPKMVVDPYQGNIYDGGYGDLGVIDDSLYAFYYQGTPKREPYIKCVKVPTLTKQETEVSERGLILNPFK